MKPERPLEIAKFRLSSRPQTGIGWPLVSGPRPSFLARSRRGSRFPASAGPIPARKLSKSRAAAEQSDPELRSFRRILQRRRDIHTKRGPIFYLLLEIHAAACCLLLRSRLAAELGCLFDLSGSRWLPLYVDYLPSRVTFAFALFDPLRHACFGTRLPGRIMGYEYYSEYVQAAASVIRKTKLVILVFFRSLVPGKGSCHSTRRNC